MKNRSFTNSSRCVFVTLVLVSLFNVNTHAQVIKSFVQRTAAATPNKLIYNIKGDYMMIGNTNLTLQSYGVNTNNSNNMMQYVDVDSDTNTFNSSSATLQFSTENGAIPACSNIIYAGLYWTGRASNLATSPETFNVTKGGVTKSFNKRTVSFKGPGQSNYTQFVANPGNIYYPDGVYGNMYSAYVEVTSYVKANGLGEYTLADMALIEGNGGGTGYYGGWGMIVVYENSKMNWRDVTIFDGHAYVVGNATVNFELPVSGFNTAQNGPINLKLGMMTGEGDVGIPGDYFKIRNWQDNAWISLNHSGNTTTNFFNGSVNTGGNPRNPNLQNNTGLDIAMFNIPNPGNTVVTNNQTSTRFQYGSTQDTYVIFCIAMAVDAYVPDVELVVSTEYINGVPVGAGPLTVQPGQDIEYKLQVKNLGTEPIDSTKFVVPIPYTTSFVANSTATQINFVPAPLPNNAYYDSTLGPTGSIVWDFGTLPMPPLGYPDSVLGELTFHLKVTKDCNILKNPDCPPNVTLAGGVTSGVGAISGTSFNNMPFIQGYQTSGGCAGEPITDPLTISIDANTYVNDSCQNTPTYRAFVFCNYTLPTIPVSSIAPSFPQGLRFFNTNNITPTSIEYDSNNPFPATIGTQTYFAIPPGINFCYYTFTISVSNLVSVPITHDTVYCLNATAVPLSAVASSSAYSLVYYTSINSTTPLTSITPSTAVAGVTTYYVAEKEPASLGGCISPNRAPIKVTVYDMAATISSQTNILCFGAATGAATVSVTGGSGNYIYSWNTTPVQTTSTATGLSANTYTVTVNDTSGCPVPVTATVTITQPSSALMASITSQTNVLCYGANTGTASVTASGGSGAYLYSWNTTPAQTTSTATGLSAITYTVTVSDSNGCATPATATVTITQPVAELGASITSQTNILCYGDSTGTATVKATGGSGSYLYSWNTLPVQTTSTASGLSAGTYSVTVTDSNGCNVPVVVSVLITQPTITLAATITSQINILCNGGNTGSATATAIGGSGLYTYTWNTNPVQTGPTAVGLSAGSYTVTISDRNGCTATVTAVALVTQPPSIQLTSVITESICDKSTGAVDLTVSGGTAPYTYSWSNSKTTQDISGLDAGTYVVTVTDSNGCTAIHNAIVTKTFLMIGLSSPTFTGGYNLSGFQSGDGSIDLTITGSSPPYIINWSNNSTNEDLENISAGYYTVVVTDSKGCSATGYINITEPMMFQMPTGISPNGDGKNDYFFIKGLDISLSNQLTVFNRWGNIVYQVSNYQNDWNGISLSGEMLPDGTYFVVLNISDKEIVLKNYLDIRR